MRERILGTSDLDGDALWRGVYQDSRVMKDCERRRRSAFIEICGARDTFATCANRAANPLRTIMPKLDEQISTLEEKLKQLKLRQQRMEARQRAVAAERERKAEMRRKVLVGGIVLAKVREGAIPEAQFRGWLADSLSRPDDRALFGLDGGGESDAR
jgi:hypothetical protein